jgi:hypothetical protein
MLTDSAQESWRKGVLRMKLVKLTTDDNPVFVNPAFVISVRKGMKDTAIQTVAASYTVKESPEVVARLLGAEEQAVDITPAAPMIGRQIDIDG